MHSRQNRSIFAVASEKIAYLAVVAVLVFAASGVAHAQADTFKVNYFDNNALVTTGAPDAVIHIVNPGTAGAPASGQPLYSAGLLCASVYIYTFDQELDECCSCPITANGELTLSLIGLTENPSSFASLLDLTADDTGSVDIIAAAPVTTPGPFSVPTENPSDFCDPTIVTPTPSLRAWSTHANFDTITGAYDVTETEFSDTTLSPSELVNATGICAATLADQSGAGNCQAACYEFSSGAKSAAKKVKK